MEGRTCQRAYFSASALPSSPSWITFLINPPPSLTPSKHTHTCTHHPQGAAVAIARGCGQCLNFNPTLVVILMMRRGLTWLRSTRVAFLFPLDQHIELHKLAGWAIFVFSVIHFLAHVVNLSECTCGSICACMCICMGVLQ